MCTRARLPDREDIANRIAGDGPLGRAILVEVGNDVATPRTILIPPDEACLPLSASPSSAVASKASAVHPPDLVGFCLDLLAATVADALRLFAAPGRPRAPSQAGHCA